MTMNVKYTSMYKIADAIKTPLETREKGKSYFFILLCGKYINEFRKGNTLTNKIMRNSTCDKISNKYISL